MWSDDQISSRKSSRRNGGITELRRSTRQTNGKRKLENESAYEWRGERRSRRLGGAGDIDLELNRDRKRSRTVESSEGESLRANEDASTSHHGNGASALKASEVAVETIRGKKKNKFWFYAVEPAPDVSSGANSEFADRKGDQEQPTFKSSSSRRVPSTPPSASEHTESAGLEASAPMSLDSEMED